MESNDTIKISSVIEKVQIFCFFMFALLWYINETRQTGKIYAIIFLIIFAAIEVLKMLKDKKVYFGKPLFVFMIFTIYCTMSFLWAINGDEAINKGIDVFLEFGFVLLGMNFFLKTENGALKLIYIITILGIIFSLYIIKHYGISNYFELLLKGKRVGGEVANVNAIGLKTSISFLLCIFLGMYKNKKYYYFLSIIPFIVSLGTGSKKVILVIVIGILLLFYKRNKYTINIKQTVKLFLTATIIIVILVTIARLPFFSRIFNRMNEMMNTIFTDTGESESTRLREIFIKVGMETFFEHPILGIGAGNAGTVTSTVSNMYAYFHNNYVELLATLGIIGFTLYYFNYFYFIYSYFKLRKDKNEYYDIVYIIFIINLITEVGLVSYANISTCLYLLLGYIVFYKNNTIKNLGEKNE